MIEPGEAEGRILGVVASINVALNEIDALIEVVQLNKRRYNLKDCKIHLEMARGNLTGVYADGD